MWQTYEREGLLQRVACLDLCTTEALTVWERGLSATVDIVYSDPPWNPGNARWWRRHAGVPLLPDYAALLAGWHGVVALCCARGGRHVFCEQSTNVAHQRLFHSSRHGWDFPHQNSFEVYYGSPGSRSVRRPNILLHYGNEVLKTNPTGMAGEPMTLRVCAGIQAPPGSWIVDPCLGKGMTSRMAHYFQWNCIGTELNPRRLATAIAWLEKQGYSRVGE